MKFELKTENEQVAKPLFSGFLILFIITLIIFLYNISTKLGAISRHYEIDYLCKILIIDKSSNKFKRLSKISNQTSKQKIWDLCREFSRK